MINDHGLLIIRLHALAIARILNATHQQLFSTRESRTNLAEVTADRTRVNGTPL